MNQNNSRPTGQFFCACFIFLFTVQQYTYAQTNATLSPGDYIEIQQLVNKFNFAIDYCTNGGRDFSNLFSDNGEYIIDSGDGMPRVINSPDELIALAGGPDCMSRLKPPTSYILHMSASLVIEPGDNGARGLSYAIYPANKGNYFNEETAGQLGIYHDEYTKTADGWRFRSRRHELNPVVGQVKL